ncbi:hypothetical protein EV1_032597 [Malus domestica]
MTVPNDGFGSQAPTILSVANRIQEERKILEKDLPDTIFVRAYETIMDCVRAVIVGAEGTPYHDGLFFFDVCFPSGYPNVPPENVLFVFWNRLQSARLEDLRPKVNGKRSGIEKQKGLEKAAKLQKTLSVVPESASGVSLLICCFSIFPNSVFGTFFLAVSFGEN